MDAPAAPTIDPVLTGERPPPRSANHLHRDRSAGLLGGVCAGLGERLGLRPSIVRVAFVAASALGGIGAFAYVALWLGLPDDEAPRVGRLRIVLAFGLAGLGVLLLLS
jgi:phage shock protein PspC (stress-responsive transcriptional regulator)